MRSLKCTTTLALSQSEGEAHTSNAGLDPLISYLSPLASWPLRPTRRYGSSNVSEPCVVLMARQTVRFTVLGVNRTEPSHMTD